MNITDFSSTRSTSPRFSCFRIVAALVVFLLFPPLTHAQDYAFRAFGEGKIPKVGDVHGLFQDSRGIIWMWGARGITFYDGIKFRHLTTEDGLPSDYCYTIHEQNDGTLLFSTYQGLVRYHYETGALEPVLQLQNSPVRDALYADGQLYVATDAGVMVHDPRTGSFLIATVADHPDSVASANYMAQQLAYDPVKRTLWAATDRYGLAEIHIDSLPPLIALREGFGDSTQEHRSTYAFYREYHGHSDAVRQYVMQDSSERIQHWKGVAKLHLLRSMDSVWPTYGVLLDSSNNAPVVWDRLNAYRFQNGRFEQLTHFHVPSPLNNVAKLPGGGFAYCRGDGFYRTTTDSVECYNRDNGLTTHNIAASLLDRQGILWILDRQSNLYRLVTPAIEIYGSDKNPLLRDLHEARQRDDGTLLLSSDRGILRLTHGRLDTVLLFNELESQYLGYGIDKNGNYLVASASRLYLYNTAKKTWRAITPSEPASNGSVTFSRAPNGDLWFLLFKSIQCWDGNRLLSRTADNVEASLYIDAVPDGRIMVGQWPWLMEFDKGVKRYYAQYYMAEFSPCPMPGNNFGNKISEIAVDSLKYADPFAAKIGALGPDKAYWVGTFNSGVVRIHRFKDLQRTLDSIQVYDTRSGLPSSTVNGLNRDQQGNLIFTLNSGGFEVTSKGVTVLRPTLPPEAALFDILKDERGRLISATSHGLFIEDGKHRFSLNRAAGLPQNAVSKISFLPSGKILGLQANSFFTVDLDRLVRDLRPGFPPLISDLHVDSARNATDQPLLISTTRRSFQCELALPDYFNEDAHRFAWKLVGFDNDFRPYSSANELAYTNLPPGTFSLEVKAINSIGEKTTLHSPLTIIVPPTFYETRLFIVLIVAVGILLAFAVVYLWLRRQRIRQENILKVEQDKLKVANQLAASIAHEFNNPLQILLSAYELNKMDTLNRDQKKHYLDRIPVQIARMRDLIQKLLTIRNIREVDYAAGLKILDIHPSAEQDPTPLDTPEDETQNSSDDTPPEA